MPLAYPHSALHRFCRRVLAALLAASGLCSLPLNAATTATTGSAALCQAEPGVLSLSRSLYADKLQGFWLGLSIGNWTGLITEMDKIGGEGPASVFYTRNDWGGADQPSIWGQGIPSELSKTIDWYLVKGDTPWGSDDDSDIEYIYLQLMYQSGQPLLTAEQIRDGWMQHIYTDQQTPFRSKEGGPENFLWVSNQQAFDLMQQGIKPPFTGMPQWNPHYDMIDAQLTTELFGALAPGRPDIAAQLAYLPIRTTAYGEAADIAQFYVDLYALSATIDPQQALAPQLLRIAAQARQNLPANQYPAKMYDFVQSQYLAGVPWEQVRDALYRRYQLEQQDGYLISGKKLYCNGCFAAGINYAASLVSYFYGAGDMQQTLKIAVLAGWDSDNPTATWGGLYGLILGKSGVDKLFGPNLSDNFNIHRTRKGFANNGLDNFNAMAGKGIDIVDKVVTGLMGGKIDQANGCYLIPGSIQAN